MNEDLVNRLLGNTLKRYYEAGFNRQALEGHDSAPSRFLRRAVQERMRHTLEEAFMLLTLIYPAKEIQDAQSRINSGAALLKSNAVEFLDTRLMGNPQRSTLLAALEDVAGPRLIETGRRIFQLEPVPHDAAIRRLLDAPDPWLQSCACHAAAGAGLRELSGRLGRLRGHDDPFLRETAEAAFRRLNRALG